jgi:hypothetical protein
MSGGAPEIPPINFDEELSSYLGQQQDVNLPLLHFTFCVLWNGTPAYTVPLDAPSAESAAITMDGLVAVLNGKAGYPPAFTWRSGECGG